MPAKLNLSAVWIAAACLASVVSPVAAAPDAASARAFVEKLYSHYPSKPNKTAFDPTGKNASAVFDPGMIAALREDAGWPTVRSASSMPTLCARTMVA